MRRRLTFLGPFLMLATLAACTIDEDILDPTEYEYDPELSIDLDEMTKTESGLYFEETTVGEGDIAAAGDSVNVLYTGWLPNGTEFDTNRDTEVLLGFTIGVTPIIPGFAEGVAGMREGGARKLVIPPHLAYGARGQGIIPPNATIVFEIELVSVVPR
jgi:FKBP-type peptidyl-prolyl cis-trans isomerase FkpA